MMRVDRFARSGLFILIAAAITLCTIAANAQSEMVVVAGHRSLANQLEVDTSTLLTVGSERNVVVWRLQDDGRWHAAAMCTDCSGDDVRVTEIGAEALVDRVWTLVLPRSAWAHEPGLAGSPASSAIERFDPVAPVGANVIRFDWADAEVVTSLGTFSLSSFEPPTESPNDSTVRTSMLGEDTTSIASGTSPGPLADVRESVSVWGMSFSVAERSDRSCTAGAGYEIVATDDASGERTVIGRAGCGPVSLFRVAEGSGDEQVAVLRVVSSPGGDAESREAGWEYELTLFDDQLRRSRDIRIRTRSPLGSARVSCVSETCFLDATDERPRAWRWTKGADAVATATPHAISRSSAGTVYAANGLLVLESADDVRWLWLTSEGIAAWCGASEEIATRLVVEGSTGGYFVAAELADGEDCLGDVRQAIRSLIP